MTTDIQVLDHGFVNFVEDMGGDRAVVQAARVCYKSDGLSEPEKDRKLIRYLLEHDHGTPFEHAVLKFHVKAPLFVARQWFRHRMSSYNETSQRYAVVPEEFYIPAAWRLHDAKNKQGSVAGAMEHDVLSGKLLSHCQQSMRVYNELLETGVAKEMARMALPVNVYTEWYWTVNARALMHFIALRSEAHAQWEIRQYSNALWKIFAGVMPWTAEAFLGTIDLQRYCAIGAGLPGPNLSDVKDATRVPEAA
jgi:thymidylate synthase (FAD)